MAIATAFDADDLTDAPQWFGAFRVTERIAEGGTAFVFRGEHRETGEAVAVKTVRTGLPHEISVLRSEIATLRNLKHPGIVRFVDGGTCHAGMPWMALELLEGRTLFDEITGLWADQSSRPRAVSTTIHAPQDFTPADGGWMFSLKDDPALSLPTKKAAAGRLWDALAVLVRLCPALNYIHARGVVHGDLKPANVFLGSDGRVTLVDFGLAQRPRRRGESPLGVRMGTTEYAAPELICGERLDATADIYSLGCILYELVTGRLPFQGSSPEAIAQQHLEAEPITPSELVCGVSWELEELMMAMLAKTPGERPRSTRDLAGKLARLVLRSPQQ